LHVDCRCDGVGCRPESDEERVALGVDDASVVRGDRCPQKASVLGESLVVPVAAELLEEGRRALDVRE
jgi:hypothetical protein